MENLHVYSIRVMTNDGKIHENHSPWLIGLNKNMLFFDDDRKYHEISLDTVIAMQWSDEAGIHEWVLNK